MDSTKRKISRLDDRRLNLFLLGIQSPINIGMILRIAESFSVNVIISSDTDCLKHDASKIVLSDFSCGAYQRKKFEICDSTSLLSPRKVARRIVATSTQPESEPLPTFEFRNGDVILLGNEYDGLPDAYILASDVVIRIPLPSLRLPKPPAFHPIDASRQGLSKMDDPPCLNVAVAAGIICYEWSSRCNPKFSVDAGQE